MIKLVQSYIPRVKNTIYPMYNNVPRGLSPLYISITFLILTLPNLQAKSIHHTFILSATITSFFAITALSHRYKEYHQLIGLVYNFFIIIAFFMIKTKSIVTFFVYYELFLLPSAGLVWLFSPNIRGKETTKNFILWTQTGSLMLFAAIIFIRSKIGSTSIYEISELNAAIPTLFKIILLMGFLVKIPTYPFYFWLIKTHVEAVTSFSIFLSGFLVKIAIYGIYMFLPMMSRPTLLVGLYLAIVSATTASIIFIHQTDYKKLIAYATVQEMSQLAAAFFILPRTNITLISIFLITHTLLSILYFQKNEALYRIFKVRAIKAMIGSIYIAPKLSIIIATGLLLFRGVPFTTKNAVEVSLLLNISELNNYLLFYWAIMIVIFGNVTFSFVNLNILAFAPTRDMKPGDVTWTELLSLTAPMLLLFLTATSFV